MASVLETFPYPRMNSCSLSNRAVTSGKMDLFGNVITEQERLFMVYPRAQKEKESGSVRCRRSRRVITFERISVEELVENPL